VTDQHQAGALAGSGAAADPGYPGEDLGLPETGPGSVASWGRRVGALCIDWGVCILLVLTLVRPPAPDVSIWILAIFGLQDLMLTSVTGLTLGKLVLRIRVARLDGKLVGLFWGLVRTLLLLLVVPPLVTDKDMRGLHDRASNTVVIRL
jgi:uncharacterized RDD family membrane protein YckC